MSEITSANSVAALAERRQRDRGVLRCLDGVAEPLERPGEQGPHDLLVFDDEDPAPCAEWRLAERPGRLRQHRLVLGERRGRKSRQVAVEGAGPGRAR